MEIYKDIIGFDGLYQISNFGNVKSLERTAWNGKSWHLMRERILKPSKSKNGYYLVVLVDYYGKRKTKYVHKLVAEAFLNHTPDGTQKLVVNHIDFDKSNNKASNLEIITQRENANQKHIKSTSEYIGVCKKRCSSKWYAYITINRKNIHLGTFENEIDAHNAYQKALIELNQSKIEP